MKNCLLILLILISFQCISQDKRILCFDLFEGTVDTMLVSDFDTTVVKENTNFFIGSANSELNQLSESLPSENIYEGVSFTKKRQASLDFDITRYPIRTSVKLLKLVNDTLQSQCSGSIISRKHVITAGHCVASINEDSLKNDSIFVSPVFDNGAHNSMFSGSWVRKVYLFENWHMSEDFSLLELEQPIGESTGWISIGFDSNDTILVDGVFYKFSYPAVYYPIVDSVKYNGDTLYYGYGEVLNASVNRISVGGAASGIPGESGSSLIKIKNNEQYTTYGVLSFSSGLAHSRMKDWVYYAFKEIIEADIEIGVNELGVDDLVSVYPNPTNGRIQIQLPSNQMHCTIVVFNMQGQQIKSIRNISNIARLDLTDFPDGLYLIKIELENEVISRKILKNAFR